MPKIPRVSYERAKAPNTGLQRQIIHAVEERYPEMEFKEIAELDEVNCHPSSVTRTVQEFMVPCDNGQEISPLDTPEFDFEIEIPDHADPQQYFDGYTDGLSAGWTTALQWIEENTNVPRERLLSRSKDS